jgi:hypothetical protein
MFYITILGCNGENPMHYKPAIENIK